MKVYVIERKREYPSIEDGPGWEFESAHPAPHDAIGICEVLKRQTKDRLRVREYGPKKVVRAPTR
jgi:hypothetical protein